MPRSGWVNRIRSPSSSTTPRRWASSMSSTLLPPSASSSCHRRRRERRDGERASPGRERAGRPTAGRRPLAGSRAARRRRPSARIEPSTRARPSSSAKNGLPAADLVNAHDHRPRHGDPEPAPQQPMDRSHRERLDRKPPERGEGAVELERHLDGPPSHRREDGHRLGVQPPQHEREHLRRAGVEPLGIVQRDEHRALLAQRSHCREQREPESARVGKHVIRLPNQQRSLESTPLQRRQPLQYAAGHEPGRADRQRPRKRPAPPTGSGASAARGRRACPQRAAPSPRERSSRSRHRPRAAAPARRAGAASRNASSARSSSRLPMISAAIAPAPSRDRQTNLRGAPPVLVRARIVDPARRTRQSTLGGGRAKRRASPRESLSETAHGHVPPTSHRRLANSRAYRWQLPP